jgi:radical SAM superfamily enzyme YgiQ (UPF0313 family)
LTALGLKGCLDEYRRFKPDLVGVSFVTISATGAYQLINAMKEETPEVHVICSGPHPSALPQEVFERSKADVVIVGEGEEAFLRVIRGFLQGRLIKGVVSSSLIKNIDAISFPDRSLVDLR